MSSYQNPTSGGFQLPSNVQSSGIVHQNRTASTTGGDSDIPILTKMESLLKTLSDTSLRDDLKLKALQEINDEFETLIPTPNFPALMNNLIQIFIKLLSDTTPQFIGENNTQQLRKLILELIHRMPCNEHLKVFAAPICRVMFKLVEIENEENALVCLRIIVELEKQFRPPFTPEVQQFMTFGKLMYRELPMHVHNIFEPHPPLQIAEIHHLDVESALQTAYGVVQIQTQQKLADGGSVVYTLLARSKQSLKVLGELPMIIVLLYQVHKQAVQQDILDFIPLILNATLLIPSQQQRNDPRFNRDTLVDFLTFQVKGLSFIAFLARFQQDPIAVHANTMVKGIVNLLSYCPHEITHLRREVMVAMRHIVSTDLRIKFAPYISQLCDENLLIGNGFTAAEVMRPMAYSSLADLVHHIRQQLPVQILTQAVYFFARAAHDPTVSVGVQTMSCKLLLNLVDCISKQPDPAVSRELLMFMLEVFIRKFKVFNNDYLPLMFEKCEKRTPPTTATGITATASGGASAGGNTSDANSSLLKTLNSIGGETPSVETKHITSMDTSFTTADQASSSVAAAAEPKDADSDVKQLAALMHSTNEKEEKFHFSIYPSTVCSLLDARALIKTLVCGVKTIVWSMGAGRVTGNEQQNFSQVKTLQAKDGKLFVRLLKYAMHTLDLFMISTAPGSPNTWQKRHHTGVVQSRDEKEVLEHFSGLFTLLPLQTFKEIFSTNIDFVVERISENLALQAVPHAFLVNVNTSPVFATILMDYLIKRLPIMGTHEEQSNLCLKLYKTVFGSVSLFAAENEQMLKPHIHKLVSSCLEMSLTAKEPYNYFLLLRGLFRSIGGGSHDLLYQEFLPLLPGLLKNLNILQNGYHRQQVKELLVELCLTVPVRLSSLVPHLPMLMEPLVSALSGSSSVILQGLRTLELCIDNLQPEYLHEHMAPVRPQMMRALAKILSSTGGSEQAATAAWRTIGKLGGLNRKMLTDGQMLIYSAQNSPGPQLTLTYIEGAANIEIPIAKAIQLASTTLRQSTAELSLRLRSFQMIRAFLVSLIGQPDQALLDHGEKWLISRFQTVDPITVHSVYRCSDTLSRNSCVEALTAILHAATSKDTRQDALPFVNSFVRYLTILAACEQTGNEALREQGYAKSSHMDSGIVADAISNVMSDEDKELCKAGILAITLVLDTSSQLLSSKEKAPDLPLVQEIVRSVVQLCYKPAWYAKLGGCSGIKYLMENFPLSWVSKNTGLLVGALMYVIVDSMGQIANGALDIAKLDLELLIKTLCRIESLTDRDEAVFRLVDGMVPCMMSWSAYARDETIRLLEMIAEKCSMTPLQLIVPHMETNLLAFLGIPTGKMDSVTIHCRIGILAAFTYLVNQQLPESKFDPCGEAERVVFGELVNILDGDKAITQAIPGYEKEAELCMIQLKTQAATAILAWKNIKEFRDRTFHSLFKTMDSDIAELQDAGFQSLQKFQFGGPDTELLHLAMRPMLFALGDNKCASLQVAKNLLNATKVFPLTFNDKLCEQVMAHLRKWLEVATNTPSPKSMHHFLTPELETCTIFVDVFHRVPAASMRFVEPLLTLLAKAEVSLNIEIGSPWRGSLAKFLARYPGHSVEQFVKDEHLRDEHMAKLFLWIMKQDSAKPCREVLQNNPMAVMGLLQNYVRDVPAVQEKLECVILRLICILAKRDRTWLPKNPQLVEYLRNLWNSPSFRARYTGDSCDTDRLKTPVSVFKCLFYYFQSNTSEINLLFELLLCLTERFFIDFEWFRKYLEKDIATTFPVEWKRMAFRAFLDMFGNPNFELQLKTRILQHIIVPCVQYSFENGEIDELVGPVPNHENDNISEDKDNLISAFLVQVVDSVDSQRLNLWPDTFLTLLSQMMCLFVEYASPHIHDTSSKRQGARLRKVMLYAWPCLQQSNSLDPAARFYGHILLAHIIDKFAINRRICSQVFHSMLKAHGQDTRHVIRHALNILTPVIAQRDDGHVQLAQFAKKLIIEEGHVILQLVHILQVIVRHHKLYFFVRHQLLQHLVNSIQKLVTQAGTLENKKLAVDVCETIIKWELRCLKKDGEDYSEPSIDDGSAPGSSTKAELEDVSKRTDKPSAETTLNFLLRLACYVPDPAAANQNQNPAAAANSAAIMEAMSKRCLHLIKVALKPDVWGMKVELKLHWLEKVLVGALNDQNQNPQSVTLACTCLDVLTYVISVLPPSQVLGTIRSIHRGIMFCFGSQNSLVIKNVQNFLLKFLTILQTDNLGTIDSIEALGMALTKALHDTFTNYEKSQALGMNVIYGPVTLLKAVCTVEPTYIDRQAGPFMKALNKLAREHIASTNKDTITSTGDMLSTGLDLICPRLEMMNTELKKLFFQTILCILLDKSISPKVIASIIKPFSDWMKLSPTSIPSTRDRQQLLLKLSQCVEKRFTNDPEIMKGFLELVYVVYKDPQMQGTESRQKLESAFLLGLCQTDAEMRNRFFEMFDGSIRKHPFERLFYIMCTQNWESLQQYHWGKQCVELLLSVVERRNPASLKNASMFARITLDDQQQLETLASGVKAMKVEPTDSYVSSNADVLADSSHELMDFENAQVSDTNDAGAQLRTLWQKQVAFWHTARNISVADFVPFIVELCHSNADLTENVWIALLKNTFAILNDTQRQELTKYIVPFLISGSHLSQRSCHPSVMKSFVEAFSSCNPPIFIKPSILQYLGRTHGLWHRAILQLEKSLDAIPPNVNLESPDDPAAAEKLEIFDSFCELYTCLNEQDLWASIWFQRAKFPDTRNGLRNEQLGLYDTALEIFEKAMIRDQQELSGSMNLNAFHETHIWEQHWTKCLQELNQWESVKDYSTSKAGQDPFMLLECAWRLPNWNLMREALTQVESGCPKEMAWKVSMYRGYMMVASGDDHQQQQSSPPLERLIEQANQLLIKEWRRLPRIVAQSHTPLLQAAQQVVELHEANQMAATMPPNRATPSIHEMKSVLKTWRNRPAAVSDSLTCWNHMIAWRLHQFNTALQAMENDPRVQPNSAIIGVHAKATNLVQFAKVARKRGMLHLAVDTLNRLHTIPTLPVVDAFQKIREQIKCCLKAASPTMKPSDAYHGSVQEALDIIENSNIQYFNKETSADLYAMKASILSQMNRWDEATRTFSTSLQLNDGSFRAWAAWAEHLEQQYCRDRDPTIATQAIVAALQAARLVPEIKSKKYLVRVFWLAKFDTNGNILMTESVAKYALLIPPLSWLFWVPQLIELLKETGNTIVGDILISVGKAFPEAILLAAYPHLGTNANGGVDRMKADDTAFQSDLRKVVVAVQDAHPCVTSSINTIMSEMINKFPYHWSENALYELRGLIQECYRYAFENRNDVQGTGLSSTIVERISRVRNTFTSENDEFASNLGTAFTTEFDTSLTASIRRLSTVVGKRGSGLVKWCDMMETRVGQLPTTMMLPEISRYMASFSTKTCSMDMFGEFLHPRMSQYCIKIAKFMPQVERVQRADIIARRFFVRGSNGKIYPFLIVRSEDVLQIGTQQRILQLFRVLNEFLAKNREVNSRLMQFDVPNLISLGPDHILLSDKESNVTMLELLRQHCKTKDTTVEDLVSRYYEKLMVQQTRGSPPSQQLLLSIMKDISLLVPKTALTNQIVALYPEHTEYFTFRKLVCLHMSVLNTAEYLFSLTPVAPQNLLMTKDAGYAHVEFFVPESREKLGDYNNRPVSFRLTPALVDFFGITMYGYMAPAMTVLGRCYQQQSLHQWLRVLLWKDDHQGGGGVSNGGDAHHNRAEMLVTNNSKALAVLSSRLQALSQVENVDGRCHVLIAAACSTENLCRMDPSWHPWF